MKQNAKADSTANRPGSKWSGVDNTAQESEGCRRRKAISSWPVRGRKEAGKGLLCWDDALICVRGLSFQTWRVWCKEWIIIIIIIIIIIRLPGRVDLSKTYRKIRSVQAQFHSNSSSDHFNLREKVLVQRLDGFGIGLDNWKKKKIFSPPPRIELRSVGLVHSSVLY